MDAKELFDRWFDGLSVEAQNVFIKYLLKKVGNRELEEGVYGGPAVPVLMKGLFAGPSVGAGRCPTCGKSY